ncbi:prostaglandin reductase 1 [Biomphalaria pfeifferi]|uniref:15-oxoprostaglandin 13-reductase n=1 Tax=Biomphalaria pfeifferi TaxID=112525 RepID=A0AAD8EY46_BIOPF|nr:prostaglandin reductase 1 [Biomphalaria pfeifferi]
MVTMAKVWRLSDSFHGLPRVETFVLTEEELPSLSSKDSNSSLDILIGAVYLSLDPYFRVFSSGKNLPGEQVGRRLNIFLVSVLCENTQPVSTVLDSKSAEYPVGSLVCVHAGWRSHSVINVTKPRSYGTKVVNVVDVSGVSPSLWLGAAGMPGVTAFMAFHNKCLSSILYSRGLTVIGIAGSNEKCQYIKDLGFDHAINYKTNDISSSLDTASPSGIDIYFDNVGGNISNTVNSKMKSHGRVLDCGSISTYNDDSASQEVRRELIELIKQGKLKTKEHVTEGFENMPAAFFSLFTGANFGKALMKV